MTWEGKVTVPWKAISGLGCSDGRISTCIDRKSWGTCDLADAQSNMRVCWVV